MTNLKCSVENCANYCEHQCCLSQIEVSGPHAKNRQETCCSSYQNEGKGCESSCHHDDPSRILEICCTAENCVHNHHGNCDAECVCVGIGNYDTCSKQETQCETFATRKENL